MTTTDPLEGLEAIPAEKVFRPGAVPELFCRTPWGDDEAGIGADHPAIRIR